MEDPLLEGRDVPSFFINERRRMSKGAKKRGAQKDMDSKS